MAAAGCGGREAGKGELYSNEIAMPVEEEGV